MSPYLIWSTKTPGDGGPKLHRKVVTYTKPCITTYVTVEIYVLDAIKQVNK